MLFYPIPGEAKQIIHQTAEGDHPDEWWDWHCNRPAVPSNHGIQQLNLSNPPTAGITYCRCSKGEQDVGSQQLGLCRTLKAAGIKLPHRFHDQASARGRINSGLKAARDACRKLGLPLIVVSISRLLRHSDYHPHCNPDQGISNGQMQFLQRFFAGIQIYTLNNPDASLTEDRALLGKLSAGAKGKRVGRPKIRRPGDLKARREKYLPLAKRLRKAGKSYEVIAREISIQSGITVAKATIKNWLCLKPKC